MEVLVCVVFDRESEDNYKDGVHIMMMISSNLGNVPRNDGEDNNHLINNEYANGAKHKCIHSCKSVSSMQVKEEEEQRCDRNELE